MSKLYIDFETCAPKNKVFLGDYGVHNYCEIAEVVSFAFAFDDRAVCYWKQGDPLPTFPAEVDMVIAHNAQFDINVWERVFHKKNGVPMPKTGRVICTMALANFFALPPSLEKLSLILLGEQDAKDKQAGKVLSGLSYLTGGFQKELKKLCDLPKEQQAMLEKYNKQDVRSMRGCFKKMSARMTKSDWDIFFSVFDLDWGMNSKGVGIDTDLARKLSDFIEKKKEEIVNKHEFNLASTQQFMSYVYETLGFELKSCRKEYLEEMAKDNDDLSELVNDRLLLVEKSANKFSKALSLTHKGRLYHLLQVFGAHTGRWAGRGVQVQNLPRADLKGTKEGLVAKLEKEGNWKPIVNTLCPMIILPDKNRKVLKADYSNIELRMAFYVAEERKVLNKIRSGIDLYVDLASEIYGVKDYKVTKEQRFVGKQAMLACQYQVGGQRLYETISASQPDFTLEDGDRAVMTYRDEYKHLVTTWAELMYGFTLAFHKAKQKHKVETGVGDIFFYRPFEEVRTIVCELPSGFKLKYYMCRMVDNQFKATRGKNFGTVWENVYGGKLFENIVQSLSWSVMVHAMSNMPKSIRLMFSVHDEVVASAKEEDYERFAKILSKPPSWCSDLPLDIEGGVYDYYCK